MSLETQSKIENDKWIEKSSDYLNKLKDDVVKKLNQGLEKINNENKKNDWYAQNDIKPQIIIENWNIVLDSIVGKLNLNFLDNKIDWLDISFDNHDIMLKVAIDILAIKNAYSQIINVLRNNNYNVKWFYSDSDELKLQYIKFTNWVIESDEIIHDWNIGGIRLNNSQVDKLAHFLNWYLLDNKTNQNSFFKNRIDEKLSESEKITQITNELNHTLNKTDSIVKDARGEIKINKTWEWYELESFGTKTEILMPEMRIKWLNIQFNSLKQIIFYANFINSVSFYCHDRIRFFDYSSKDAKWFYVSKIPWSSKLNLMWHWAENQKSTVSKTILNDNKYEAFDKLENESLELLANYLNRRYLNDKVGKNLYTKDEEKK